MIKVDMAKRTVIVNGSPVVISNPQWDVLEVFSTTEGITIEKAAQRAFGSQSDKNKTATSVIVSRIRKALGKDFIMKGRGGLLFINPETEVIEKEEITE